MNICNARPSQAAEIARLIMTAMNHECCRYFTGSNHSLAEFERVMTRLVTSADSQYSYLNTLTALDDDGKVAGICVTYDGADLHRLREAFVQAAKEAFGRDFSQMDDETAPGELYIDSLAVDSPYRGQGIATALLQSAVEKAKTLRLPAIGLLVDKGNPDAERLYRRVGFSWVGDSQWGGHPMRHLQIKFGPNDAKE
ncbi:MAG: GNAT family N-acetyltransferase [Prevotella sp.]|nr:GNAT family N-acetyltransferase [Prevotella sp.]